MINRTNCEVIKNFASERISQETFGCSDFNELSYKKYGQPLKLMLTKKLTIKCKYIKNLREAGVLVNTAIVIAIGKGIIMD